MLQQISIYLLKVTCISGLLFLYYQIALRNKQFHYYNRFYLLLSAGLSAVLPFLQLQWFTFFSNSPQTIHLYKIMYGRGEDDVTVNGNASVNFEQIAVYILAAITVSLIITFCIKIAKIQRLKKKYPVQKLPEFDFINTDVASAPFSFFKNIFWRNDISLNEETGKQILQHELTHIKQKHSWDKTFIQLVLCFCWMNPFYHLIKKELFLIHEFIADEKAVKHSDADAFAKMLLTAHFGKFDFLPAQPIFYSPIKRRLIMLTTSKKPGFSYVRRMLVLPLIASLVCLFAFTIKNETAKSSNKKITVAQPFVLVVDAGHGGEDNGAFGNGLYEKDVTLKIAEKIKSLSSDYGINVILIRNSDVFMNPREKSNFANAQNANAFISIHVNAAENQSTQSGFGVILAKSNAQISPSTVLGSAILQNLQTNFTITQELLQSETNVFVLKNSLIPAALIECGYITNANDAATLKDDSKIELIAKSILQGVAIYANNKVDKSSLYQINSEYDSIPPRIKKDTLGKTLKTDANVLYVLNGKVVPKSVVDKTAPSSIESINVLKGKDATNKYGDKGKYGVVEITLKKGMPPPPPPGSTDEINAAPNPPTTDTLTETKPVFNEADQQAQFPGGVEGWQHYLMQNLKADVPAKHNAPNGIYKVTVSFLVDENGNVSNVKAIKDPGYGTGDEAVRIIAQGPKWIPAVQDGHKITFMQKQNITFQVSE